MLNRIVVISKWVVHAIMIAFFLTLANMIGSEIVAFLLSPFYGSHTGSFLLTLLSLGSFGVATLFFYFLDYFQTYIFFVIMGVFFVNVFAGKHDKKISLATGMFVSVAAIATQWLIQANRGVFEYTSTRLILNDAVTSFFMAIISVLVFYNQAIVRHDN